MRSTLDALAEEASIECAKFSEDVKFWAEFQTGVKVTDSHGGFLTFSGIRCLSPGLRTLRHGSRKA